jgi:hypothetical protein
MDINKLLTEFRHTNAPDKAVGAEDMLFHSFHVHIDWHTDGEHDEPEFALPVADDTRPRLVRLPPSPFRSFGGYFNYEGWPDQQRFMELDEALRRQARENHQSCKTNT